MSYLRCLLSASAGFLLLAFMAFPSTSQAQDNVVYDTTLYNGMKYRMIGPYRGGRSTAVAGHKSHPYTFYMGSTGGGVWKTADAGESWTNISDGFFDVASIGAIDVANSDPSVIYVGTGSADIRGNVSTGRGVYKSTDGGDSWAFMGLKEAGQIGRINVHPTNSDVAYLAALGHPFGKNEQRGVFRTTDGGDSWEKVLFVNDSTGAIDLAMNPQNPREIYAAMWRAERNPWTLISGAKEGNGIYRTTDGGDTWKELEKGLPKGAMGKIGITVSPANPNRVWALIEAREPEGGLYRSDDAGRSWTRVNRNRKLRQRAYYYMHTYAHPQDPNTVYGLNVRFFESTDGGEEFEHIPVPHGDTHDLWINPENPELMIIGDDGGAQVTLNGGESWTTYYNQPTAEFYSVTVDNQFPYRVYGPQQDNSTISLPNWNAGGISPKQYWFSVGGCETGPIALHPDHPNVIYAGCYGGVLTRYNRETEQRRDVMLYPQLQLGQAPKNLKERFQWVSPIVVSPHDPDVVYHASQRIHRTTDGGMTWETISPDLTTDTPKHQKCGGRPITCEDTGVEIYNTVFALTVSPHTPETIWAGTDDGRVHISRDRGDSWREITPDDMPRQGTVSRIEVSPHDAGTAYLAVYRYRMDDFAPYIFKTEDYGESWERLTSGENGIPVDSPVRVVREDPEREGLLYAGTEFGMHVSFDDGQHWQPLQRNLPVTPITDLKVHRGDLVVATQGRSFWVMDDLTPLHELSDRIAESDRHLFNPRHAYRVSPAQGGSGRWPEGPPDGALIYYYLAEKPEAPLTLEILDTDGQVIRRFHSKTDTAMMGAAQDTVVDESEQETARAEMFEDEQFVMQENDSLTIQPGLNRFVWNLRTPNIDEPEEAVTWGYTGGVKVPPGRYRVRLSGSNWQETRTVRVLKDPRLENVTRADFEEQYDLATELHHLLNNVYDALSTLRSVREQVQATAARAEKADRGDIVERADSIMEALTTIEQELIQTKNEAPQDPINYPPQLDNQIAYLYGYVAGPEGRPTEGARRRLRDVRAEWEDLRERLRGVLTEDVSAFNEAVSDLPAVVVK